MSQFIVGEVSKNWLLAETRERTEPLSQSACISGMFQTMIEHNLGRGYALRSWNMTSVFHAVEGAEAIVETVVAVFEKEKQ